MTRRQFSVVCIAAILTLAACSTPEGFFDDAPEAAPGMPVQTDARVGTLQLYQTGNEVSLPVIPLNGVQTLTLEFDIMSDEGSKILDIEFRRVDRDGGTDLLPSEYIRGFDRDDILDADPSGTTRLPYTHYSYSFPNASVGFTLGGEYVLRVTEPGVGPLFEQTFFVNEDLVVTELFLGTRLAEAGAIGEAIQPSARLSPRSALRGEDAFRFTVCFARNGDLGALRCAPEPSLTEQAIYGFYLPRSQAFPPALPVYELDLGRLGPNQQVLEVDYESIPPSVTMEVDQADFGGEFFEPALLVTSQIDATYQDGGNGDDDAEYVDVRFRYQPRSRTQVTGPVYIQGPFASGVPLAQRKMTWTPEASRYETTLRVKQGRYAYQYTAPRATTRQRPVALGQPTIFTAFVFFEDLTRFTQRLVGVESVTSR